MAASQPSGRLPRCRPGTTSSISISAASLAEVRAIIAAADASLGQIPQNHWYMIEAIRLAGTEAQKRFYFQAALDGDRFGNAFTEIGTKTALDFQTTVLRDKNGGR